MAYVYYLQEKEYYARTEYGNSMLGQNAITILPHAC